MPELNSDSILKYLETEFERELCKAAFDNLSQETNKLKFSNFSYTLRELIRHTLVRLSPDKHILNCSWYTNQIPDSENRITRAQRIKYSIQGGIDDNTINNVLNLDIDNLNTQWKDVLEVLNKYTHINEDALNISSELISSHVNECIFCFHELFRSIKEARETIIIKLEQRIEETIIDQVISNYIEEIGEMATHYWTNGLDIDNYEITDIDHKNIMIEVTGNIYATLQYGSDSDVRNDIGGTIDKDFQFKAIIQQKILNLNNPELEVVKLEIEKQKNEDE
ncbi:MAG: hypothetical protein WBB02_03845 [Saprospiraceae bacterium]